MVDYKNRITPENITELKFNECFIFGSNLLGRHGAGAALQAVKFGAVKGQGFGLTIKDLKYYTFAIPTKGVYIEPLPIKTIKYYINYFFDCIIGNIHTKFFVTKIGCGLAGYTPEQIAPLFKKCIKLDNVYLPIEFWNILLKIK